MTRVVYAYVIVSSEPVHDPQLDIVGYRHDFWPGQIMMLPDDDTGGRHILTDELFPVDELLSFKVTAVRVAKGEQGEDDTVTFPEEYRQVLAYLQRGALHSLYIRDAVSDFGEILKEKLTPEKLGADDAVVERLHAEIDAQVRLVR